MMDAGWWMDGRWMDGRWMDGWVDGWMDDGWVDGERYIDTWIGRLLVDK
jgi:hypothetical protein